MQWPIENRKVRNLTVIIMFLVSSVAIIFFTHYESPEEKAIRDWVGAPKKLRGRSMWRWPAPGAGSISYYSRSKRGADDTLPYP